MFRINFMVNDKDLVRCLHAVKGFALNMDVPQPVVHVGSDSAGTTVELVARELNKMHANSDILNADVAQIIQHLGRSPSTAPAVIQALVKAKIIKRIKAGVYRRSTGKISKRKTGGVK